MARIGILWHARMPRFRVGRYAIHQIGEHWKQAGHEVEHLFGARRSRRMKPFDACLLHVDLSSVPRTYAEHAARLSPVVLNGNVLDIRKSTVSMLRVDRQYAGPVIVKTDLNCYGAAERWHGMWSGFRSWSGSPYPVYPSASQVPARYWTDSRFIVEAFVSESEGTDTWSTHSLTCIGPVASTIRVTSSKTNVKGSNSVAIEQVENHPKASELRKQWKLDYGKLDYILKGDEVLLIDVNKTSGRLPLTRGDAAQNRAVHRRLQERSQALDAILSGAWRPHA